MNGARTSGSCNCGLGGSADERHHPDCPRYVARTPGAKPTVTSNELAELIAAAEFAADVLSIIYGQYQRKIGAYASQAQEANARLGPAIRALKAHTAETSEVQQLKDRVKQLEGELADQELQARVDEAYREFQS